MINTNNTSMGDYPRTIVYPVTPTITTIPTNTVVNKKKEFKPKKAGKNGTHVVFILDASSSMSSVKTQTISGYNEFLDTHRKNAITNRVPTYISLYTFDGSKVDSVFYKRDVRKVDNLTAQSYRTNGMTNLNDAIAIVMHKVNKELTKFKKEYRPDVNICILTDGAENASTIYGTSDVKSMVEAAEGKKWGFMFLGANIDAFSVGSLYGMSYNNTIQYDVSKVDNAFRAAARSSVDLSTNKLAGNDLHLSYASASFTDEERGSAI